MDNKLTIRNSTTEFLIFTSQAGEDGIEVKFEDENVWLSQKMMSKLFDVQINTINEHLKHIFFSNELDEISTIRNFRIVQKEGNRNITRKIDFYNLDAIISVGYRINSQKATRFRIWATKILKEFAIKGYVLDSERLKNGTFLNRKYFDDLLLEIREIRASERQFYQKITDIYSTSIDYNKDDELTREFFSVVQNKLHFAVHGNTAAELIMTRANKEKDHMGLTTWKKSPNGKIIKSDVSIAKNYLNKKEIESLNRIVTMYLDYAEDQAKRGVPVTMSDWSKKLNAFLKFNDRDILNSPGKVTNEIAKHFAENEFEKYRLVQDKLFESDFDKETKKLLSTKKK
ncbi:MAG: virulence RhuM family protein [archaeon]